MSDKLFDILLLLLIGFVVGVFSGERINCKRMGMKYSYDYGCIKGEK